MTEQAAPAPAGAAQTQSPVPVALPAPPAQESATAAQPAGPKPGDVGTPEWLNPRLEQARRSAREALLKEVGAEDPEVLKRALADSRARQDAEKTASERLAAEQKAREKAEREAETYRAALSTRADAEFAKLAPEQQAFVEGQAGADPARRLAAIDGVRALLSASDSRARAEAEKLTAEKKLAEGAAPPKPALPAERKPLPAPASTAAGGAPPAGQPSSPPDLLAQLDHLDRVNPYAAGQFYDKHRAEITRLRAQKTAGTAAQ